MISTYTELLYIIVSSIGSSEEKEKKLSDIMIDNGTGNFLQTTCFSYFLENQKFECGRLLF